MFPSHDKVGGTSSSTVLSNINTAQSTADTAQSTADSKSKTFTSTPTVPYYKGDIWKNGNTVYICNTTRTTGAYTSSEWTLTADKTSENTAADTSKVNGISSSTVINNISTAQSTATTYRDWETDRKSTRLNSSHITRSRMPSSA